MNIRELTQEAVKNIVDQPDQSQEIRECDVIMQYNASWNLMDRTRDDVFLFVHEATWRAPEV
jgi:hypothetical protein